jgi:ATP-dependent DNA helicase DinG
LAPALAPVDTSLPGRTREALSAGGPLALRDARFQERQEQQAFAAAVAQALDEREALVVEAGTGVGKTYAYLVPLLLAGRRALVSTATKALQDQLYLRDLPGLAQALGVPMRLALLKGRASYLCRHRLGLVREQGTLPDRFAVRQLARVEAWASATRTGDLAEIDGLDERSPLIPLVTSTRDNCLGSECPKFAACHVVAARREAMQADLVVVNHHLFFADIALRDSGVAELLPTVDAAVFDEAHQLVETGVQFLGRQISTGQCLDLARDLLALGLQHARGLQPWHDLAAAVERAARELRLACAGRLTDVRGVIKLHWRERAAGGALQAPLEALAEALQAAAEAAALIGESSPDLAQAAVRAQALRALAQGFTEDAEEGRVRWIDLSPQQARLVDSPLDIREMLGEQRQRAPKAWVFTSATLGDDAALSWFTRACGLEDARVLKLGSPFDYPRHARLWVPPRFAKPADAGHPAAVGALAARVAQALNGRTFVLTTTLRVLPAIAEAVRRSAEGAGLSVLVQGERSRREMLERYGNGRGAVLLGSQSFWEGIDMPGDALQAVVIDKLPFPPPNDPLVQARSRVIESRGGSAFDEYFLAEAAVSLKQGGGRLIRSETDRGVLVVCDPRLAQMGYGARLLRALPPMARCGDEAELFEWLAVLAADHRD